MFLCLGVHVRRTDSHDGRTAVIDDMTLFVEPFAQGFCQKLDIPFRQGFQVVRIRHEDFQVPAMTSTG